MHWLSLMSNMKEDMKDSRIWRRHAGIKHSFALTKYTTQQWVEIYTHSARIQSRKSYSFITQYLFSTLYVPESTGDMEMIKTGLMMKNNFSFKLWLYKIYSLVVENI